MECCYRRYCDPEFESLIERIHPPRVSIDNDACEDCTLVKVDSANKYGILLEMVQVLTDLDLIISKSYVSSDGRWCMDVFHVTDQLGHKLTDESLIHYIQQVLCDGTKTRRNGAAMRTYQGRVVALPHALEDHTVLEMAGADRPGLLSEVSAVLAAHHCHVEAAEAWTHNKRAACIIYVKDGSTDGPIMDQERLAHLEEQLEFVAGAHHGDEPSMGEEWRVRLAGPTAGRTHTQRRLHQLMYGERDYEVVSSEGEGEEEMGRRKASKEAVPTEVLIEWCREKGYWVLTVRCRDRPKLLFDTVCTLTDMDYIVFHAAISSHGSLAVQEYYIRNMKGCNLDSESEKQRVTQCLVAAVERRVSKGLRLDVCTSNSLGLLSDITRVVRENGLSIARAEITTRGNRAMGTFYVTDASGNPADPKTVESVCKEIGGTVLKVNNSPSWTPPLKSNSMTPRTRIDNKPRFSMGTLLWSQFEWLSSNFGKIRS